MAANPALVPTGYGLVPVPYAGEWIGLARPGVEIVLEGMPQGPRKWTRRGQIFLTNLRMVFVADVPDGANGLQSYDLPFGYITSHSFHQPILGSNNLKGQCRLGAPGSVNQDQSLNWAIYFKTGGVGTFLPLFFSYLRPFSQPAPPPVQQPAPWTDAAPPTETAETETPTPSAPPAFLQTAFVDPSDPTRIFLTQQVPPEDQSQKPCPYTLL